MVLKNRPVIVERKAMFVVFVGSTFAVDDVDDGVRTGVSETGVRKKERREKNANEREREREDRRQNIAYKSMRRSISFSLARGKKVTREREFVDFFRRRRHSSSSRRRSRFVVDSGQQQTGEARRGERGMVILPRNKFISAATASAAATTIAFQNARIRVRCS